MVRVDVDDHHVVEVALVRLFARMRQQAAGIEFLDRYAPTAISDEIHGVSPDVPFLKERALPARPALPHAELENCEIGGL
jgi:hypothetical protein